MVFDIRLRVYAPNGAALGLMPDELTLSASFPHNDAGALMIDASRVGGIGGHYLERALAEGLEFAVEVTDHAGAWVEPTGARFLWIAKKEDQKDAAKVTKVTAQSYAWPLVKAKNIDSDHLLPAGHSQAGKRPFRSASAGVMLATLLQENEDRGGVATVLSRGFTATTDSAGKPWAKVTTLDLDWGLDLRKLLASLTSQGMCDWRTQARALHVYNPDTICAADKSATVRLTLRDDVVEAPSDESIEEIAGRIALRGDGGTILVVDNPTAPSPWGVWEEVVDQGGVSDPATMKQLVQAEAERRSRTRQQFTRGLLLASPQFFPMVDYAPGEWITAPTSVPAERVRVQQVTLTKDAAGVGGSVILNDRILDAELRRAKRMAGIVGGSAADGGSGARPAPEGPDKRTPAAPRALVVDSDAYLDTDGAARGVLSMTWGAVTAATDGTAMEIATYDVAVRENVAGAPWSVVRSTDDTEATHGPVQVGAQLAIKVRAKGKYSTTPGQWSAAVVVTVARDVTAPPVPSVLVAVADRGVVRVTWDGKTADGAKMPTDFARVEVEQEGRAGTLAGTILDVVGGSIFVTGLSYGAPARYRARAVDRSGNASAWSAWSKAVTPTPQTADDIDPKIVAAIEANSADFKALAPRVSTAETQLTDARTRLAAAETKVSTAITQASTASSQASTATAQAQAAQAAADTAAAAAAAAMQAASNACENWSLETGDLTGWTTATGPAPTVVASTTAAHGGRVMQVTTTATQSYLRSNRTAAALAAPGQTWLVRARVRVVGTVPAAGTVAIGVVRSTAAGTLTTASLTEVGAGKAQALSTDWVTVEGQHTIPAGTTTGIRAMLLCRTALPAGTVIQWDAVELLDYTPVLAAQQAAATALATAQAAHTAAGSAQTTAASAVTAASGAQKAADAAAEAAQAAQAVAGTKGKVIVQSTAPATADRLAQNLWIDTTGGSNTPKRWNGTAWVAVTDKVATDAAKAAADALAAAQAVPVILHDTGTPAGTAPKGSTWMRHAADGGVIGQWEQTASPSGGTWVSRPIRSEVIANLDVGKLTAGTSVVVEQVAQKIAAATAAFQRADVGNLFVTGTATVDTQVAQAIWTAKLVAGKVLANEVIIGGGANLVKDAFYDAGRASWAAPVGGSGSGFAAAAALPGHIQGVALVQQAAGTSNMSLYAPTLATAELIPVQPGEVFTAWAQVKATGAVPAGFTSASCQVYFYDATKTMITGTPGNQNGGRLSALGANAWTTIGGTQVTAPDGAAFMSPRPTIYITAGATPNSTRFHIGEVRVLKAVGSALIIDGSVLARHIKVGELEAIHFKANTGTVDMMKVGFLDGYVVTGAVIRTAASGARVELNATNLRAYNASGVVTAEISGATATFTGATFRTAASGARVQMSGSTLRAYNAAGAVTTEISGASATITGGTITGGRIQTSETGSPRAVMTPTTNGDGAIWLDSSQGQTLASFIASDSGTALRFYDKANGVRGANRFILQASGAWWYSPSGKRGIQIQSSDDGSYASSYLWGPEQGSDYSYLKMGVGQVDGTISRVAGLYSTGADASYVQIHGAGSWWLGSSTRGRIAMDNSSGELYLYPRSGLLSFYNLPATTAAGQPITMVVSATGRPSIYRNSSVRASKVAIEDIGVDPYKVLDVRVRDWYDRTQAEAKADALTRAAEFGGLEAQDLTTQAAAGMDLRRIPGVVAEELEAAGLAEFCSYDERGELVGVQYDRLALLLIPVVRDLRTRFDMLAAQVAAPTILEDA